MARRSIKDFVKALKEQIEQEDGVLKQLQHELDEEVRQRKLAIAQQDVKVTTLKAVLAEMTSPANPVADED